MIREHGSHHSQVSTLSETPAHRDTTTIEIASDGVVFHQGETAEHWYEVISGTIRMCRFQVDGQRQLTGFFFSGDVFGYESGRHDGTAEAVTKAVLKKHAFGEAATSTRFPFSRALENAQQCIYLLGHRTASERLAAFLLSIARRPGMTNRIELPMSRMDIADYLGLTIHTVSRTISEFGRQGIISIEGRKHVNILDRVMLRTLAGETQRKADPATTLTRAENLEGAQLQKEPKT